MSQPNANHHANNSIAPQLNRLRAAVLGANDGIVSVAGVVVGVAGATSDQFAILAAGVAALVAGALSMAAGEYVSVSSQSDTEKVLLQREKNELRRHPQEGVEELAQAYRERGLSDATARQVALELSQRDPYTAHVDVELRLDPDALTSPWQAAVSSALAFLAGAIIPIIAILLPPPYVRVGATFAAVVLALGITGLLSAKAGGANPTRAALRVIIGGILAMTITYLCGRLVGINA
jgi:VIT1/CCC1 family predicted Fe2+/Mn2+ transporter